MFFKRKKDRTPEDLTIQELLAGTYVGDYSSWYEHELFRKMEALYEQAPDKKAFIENTVENLPGYNAAATDIIYRSRGIEEAFIFQLPDVEHFDSPACALYRHPDAPRGRTHNAWSIVRYYHYRILPRFYEPMDQLDFNSYGILDGYPELDGWSPMSTRGGTRDFRSIPKCDITTGIVSLPARAFGCSDAANYARDLKSAMGTAGILCDPVVFIEGRDYDPYAVLLPDNRSQEEPHPYMDPSRSWPVMDDDLPYPYLMPPYYHKVVPDAGPGVPNQETAQLLLDRLRSWGYWESRARQKSAVLADTEIPEIRRPVLRDQYAQAKVQSRAYQSMLFDDPHTLLGLILSLNNGLDYLVDAIHPLLHLTPGEDYNQYDLPQLASLHFSIGGLFGPGRQPNLVLTDTSPPTGIPEPNPTEDE